MLMTPFSSEMAAEPVEIADEDGRRNVAHVLGDPEPDIGRTGDDGGLRMVLEDLGEIVGIGRHDQPLVALADLDARRRHRVLQAAR